MFTDSHCHIFNEYYENIDSIIENAKNNNVNRLIVAATDIKSSYEVVNLAKNYKEIFICLGIHPDSINDSLEELEEIINKNLGNKLIAIGEIGLDYYYGKETKDKQIEIFDKQLSIAEKYKLPVVVHSREATKDTMDILKKHNVKGVLHCFSGSLETAKEYIKMGYYFGVNGVMTFKNSKIDEVIMGIPLQRIILETDSPYLTPDPFRKYQNEPKYIYRIAEYLADLKGISIDEVSRITEENIKDVFDI